MKFQIPSPMVEEHDELHQELTRVIQVGGEVGKAAQNVADVLHAHFEREEVIALPPLGLLSELAADRIVPEMAEVLPLTDALKAELPKMLSEHQGIVDALEVLKETSIRLGNKAGEEFSHKLRLHALTEEQVSYPTTILIGEYLKLKLGRG